MKKTQLIPIALLSVSAVANAQNTSCPPNIILFLVDDMGWEDTSLPFWTQKTHYNEVYETPNMERCLPKPTLAVLARLPVAA